MDWRVAVLTLAGLALLLGVLLLAKAGPKPPDAPDTLRAERPEQPSPVAPTRTRRQPVGVWEIAQGVFWGLWMFVLSGAVLFGLVMLYLWFALGGNNP